ERTDLAQVVADATAGGRRRGGHRALALPDEVRDLLLVELEELEDRVELGEERSRGVQQATGAQAAEDVAQCGQPLLGGIDQRREVDEQPSQVGGQQTHRVQRRAQVVRNRLQVADQRIGVQGKGLELRERQPRLAQEGREDRE